MLRFHPVLFSVLGLLPATRGWSAAPTSVDGIRAQSTTLLADADKFWSQEFISLHGKYQIPTPVLYTRQSSGACGSQAVLTGPFYCPSDQHLYLDQSFLQQLAQRAQNASELALAYVIGHEVGHHIQYLIGTTALVEDARARSTPAVSARTWTTAELQADCYAGLWVRAAVEDGTIASASAAPAALNATAAISEEREKHLTAGQTMADLFPESTAAQRLKWFRRGEDSGDFGSCDTFGAEAAGQL